MGYKYRKTLSINIKDIIQRTKKTQLYNLLFYFKLNI